MEGRFLLDIIIGQGAAVFKLLSREDQTLLIRRNPLFILNLRFYVVDGVRRFDLKGDRFTSQSFDD